MITISSGLILDRYGKLNFRKCFLSVVLLNVLLFCYINNNLGASGVALVISRKLQGHHLNVSSTCETTVFSAINCIQTSLNESDHHKSINVGTSVATKDQHQTNKETHGAFNNSNLADSQFDYIERAEKGNETFFLASKKQLSQGIQDDVTFVDCSWVNDFGKRGPSYGFAKIDTEVLSMKNISDSKKHHEILEVNGILRFFSQEINQDEKSAMQSVTYVGYVGSALSFVGILVLKTVVQLQLLAKNNHSKIIVQSLTASSSSWKMIIGLVLLLFQTPVGSDYAMSYSTGTYFRNEGEGRALHGYVNQSFPISTMFECQLKCSILHPTCKSINYIENEDGSNVCEINNEAKYCALPGDFIVKENSFYVEVVPRHDEQWCSTCGHRGVIVKTKEVPGYKCLCRKEFYGDKCQNATSTYPECSQYSYRTEANRNEKDTSGTVLCDNGLSTGWYRFGGQAGLRIATTCVPENRCGTHASGWMNGTHPTVSEGKVTRTVCYHYSSNCCNWSNNIEVLNCGSYYIYKLRSPPNCSLRYCGSNS